MRTEKGERHATFNEFLLLAAALNVPPPLLLLPIGDEDLIEVTPQSRIHPHLAYRWFTGSSPLAASDRTVIDPQGWKQAREPLRLYDRHDELAEAVTDAESKSRRARVMEDDLEGQREASREFWSALERYYEHLLEMVAAGVKPPRLNQNRLRDMDRLELDTSELPSMSDEEMEEARTWGERKLDWPDPVPMEGE